MNKKWDDKFPTLGVSKNGINYQLIIGTDFWNSLTPIQHLGLLKHELLHCCLSHIEMADRFPDKQLANIAYDLVCNQLINHDWLPGCDGTMKEFKAKWEPIANTLLEKRKKKEITDDQYRKEMLKIPARGVLIKDYFELNLLPNESSKYYYDKLQQGADKKKQEGSSGCQALDDMLDQMEANNPTICDHKSWQEFQGLSDSEKKLMRAQVEHTLREVAEQITKSRGTIPSEMSEIIKMLNHKEPPKFDWKGYLRNFIGGSTKTYVKKTRRKESKRFEGSPGQRVLTQKHVLLMLDCSGSVSNDELKEFLGEMCHINRTGTEITVVQFDAAISNVSKFNHRQADAYTIHGRGGTSFTEPIDYYNEKYRKFCCGIVLTDGECPPPENKPRGKVLWVHSSKSTINKDLPGYCIKLN